MGVERRLLQGRKALVGWKISLSYYPVYNISLQTSHPPCFLLSLLFAFPIRFTTLECGFSCFVPRIDIPFPVCIAEYECGFSCFVLIILIYFPVRIAEYECGFSCFALIIFIYFPVRIVVYEYRYFRCLLGLANYVRR